MEGLEAWEDPQTPESKEVLLRVFQHAIFTWILIEYYHSYSLLVLCLRAVQAFATFRPKPVQVESIVVKGMGTVLIVLQLLIFTLQLLSSRSSPIALVFVGYTYPPSGLGILFVDCVIGALMYMNFAESTMTVSQGAPMAEADVELGLRRLLRQRRRRPG